MAVNAMLASLTFLLLMLIFFQLLDWAETAPPEVRPVKGLCDCPVSPYTGLQGLCRHKGVGTPTPERISYVPRHAAA